MHSSRKLLWAVILLVILATISSIGVYYKDKLSSFFGIFPENSVTYSDAQKIIDNQKPTSRDINSKQFVFEPANLEFTLADKWQVTEPTLENPIIFNIDPVFAFQKVGTTCEFIYAKIKMPFEFVQSGFSPFIYNADNEQVAPSWYIDKNKSQGPFNDAENYSPGPGEFWLANYKAVSNNSNFQFAAFIFVDTTGAAPSADCLADVTSMVKSVKRHVEPANLGMNSSGTLFMTIQSPSVLMYGNSGGIIKRVINMDTSTMNPVIYKNDFYITNAGKLVQLNIFTNSSTEVSGITYAPNEVVNSVFFYKGTMYFLKGPNCAGNKSCDLDLYMKEGNNSAKLLASHVKSGTILGYDAENNSLYLQQSYGDAGFLNISTEVYSFNFGTLTNGKLYSYGPSDSINAQSLYKDFTTKFKNQNLKVPCLVLNAGKMLPKESCEYVAAADINYNFETSRYDSVQ